MVFAKHKYLIHLLLTVLVTAASALWAMHRYVDGPLAGDFSKHIMSARIWGVPDALKARGIEPLYMTQQDAGWDGQFYYYMANDLLARKDTARHIDSDAYRYQRIGLPLVASAVALVTLQDWVSPLTYYATSLALVLAAVAVGGVFFARCGISPLWMLPWALGVGTQLTLLNGLPDAAADALLIIALVACVSRRYMAYGVAISLAALAREAYVLFPAVLLAGMAWVQFWKQQHRYRLAEWLACLLPLVLFALWHLYVRIHFTNSPASQSAQVLGMPLASTLHHLFAGLQGAYPGLRAGADSRVAGLGIAAYLVLVATTLAQALRPAVTRDVGPASLPLHATAVFLVGLIGLYLCFGDTVMWYFTGYMKAANLFLFALPFLAAISGGRPGRYLAALFLVMTAFFDSQAWLLRVAQPPIVALRADPACARNPASASAGCTARHAWTADKLPGQTGKVRGKVRTAGPGDSPGFLTFGPFATLEAGRYRISLRYTATAGGAEGAPGRWEAGRFSPESALAVLHKADLPAPGNGVQEAIVIIPRGGIEALEVRAWFNGRGTLTVERLELEKLD